MAGCASIATAAAIASAAVGAAGTAYGIVNGQEQKGAQQDALKKQTTAQDTATANALSTQRQSIIAQNDVTKQTPNVSAVLKRAATVGGGLGSTMLTGSTGVNPSSLNLGGATLLGS